MKKIFFFSILIALINLTGCKKAEESPPVESAQAPTQTAAPSTVKVEEKTPAEPTEAEIEAAEKQKLMDYATMEDTYINDPKAQWANAAKASSTFGDEDGKTPASSNAPENMIGKVDGETWTNNHQDIGFDWMELGYEKPVSATEVRLVIHQGAGAEAISKVELQDTEGKWNTVWSGISDVKRDSRGNRTWFVKTFPKTTYQVKAVKYTIANNLFNNYKVIDAVQLVGE